MRLSPILFAAASSLALAACGSTSDQAVDVAIGTNPPLPEPKKTLIPTVNVAKAAGLAVSACGAQVRPVHVPAQHGETGTHRDRQPTVVGIPGL